MDEYTSAYIVPLDLYVLTLPFVSRQIFTISQLSPFPLFLFPLSFLPLAWFISSLLIPVHLWQTRVQPFDYQHEAYHHFWNQEQQAMMSLYQWSLSLMLNLSKVWLILVEYSIFFQAKATIWNLMQSYILFKLEICWFGTDLNSWSS